MTIVEITGGMLRAARSLTGLSQQELAERASSRRQRGRMRFIAGERAKAARQESKGRDD